MRIGLIGMSGAGKTYRARQLASLGFEHLGCDDMIAARLAADLGRPVSFADLNNWLGLPYEPGFQEREAKFLSYETQTMESVLDKLARSGDATDLVIDMSGSAIYGGRQLFDELRRHISVIYLAVTPELQQKMYAEYARRPRAVVWHGQFRQEAGQTQRQALNASYLRLVAQREELYEAYCDVKLPRSAYGDSSLTPADFAQLIAQALELGDSTGSR